MNERVISLLNSLIVVQSKGKSEMADSFCLLALSQIRNMGEFKHEVRQFEKSYDNQQAEQISLMV